MSLNYFFTHMDYSYTYSNITSESAWHLQNTSQRIFYFIEVLFLQVFLPTILGLRIITYMCAKFTLYRWYVSTSSTQIVPKVSIRLVSNFSELIWSNQFSPQQMQWKYHKGKNIRPHNIQFRHMVLLWSWIPVHCLISEAFSFMWNS